MNAWINFNGKIILDYLDFDKWFLKNHNTSTEKNSNASMNILRR